MKPPKTPDEFEYDLCTTLEGSTKRYWAKIKETGEVSEIDVDVMLCLRSEEKRIRREMEEAVERGGSDFQLSTIREDGEGES